MSVVMQCGAGGGEEPFCQSEEVDHGLDQQVAAGDWPHRSHCDDGLTKASVKKEDLEHQVVAHSFKLETAVSKTNVIDGDVAQMHADLGDLSRHLKMNAMRVDELEGVVNPMMTDV